MSASPGATATADRGLEELVARADLQLEVPTTTTPLASLGLIEDQQPLDGQATTSAVSADGEAMVGVLGSDGKYHAARLRLGETPTRIDESYATYNEASNKYGGAGTPAISAEAMAWLAFPDGRNDLSVNDFTVYSADRLGHHILKIGQSASDVTDEGTGSNIAPPAWRERLMISRGRAFWTEAVRRFGGLADPVEVDGESSIGDVVMSAPLDGSEAQRATLPGWYPGEDLCTPVEDPALIYLDSAISQVPDTGTASVHRAVVGPDGTVESDTTIWSAPESRNRTTVLAAAACGDTVAVSWVGQLDEDSEAQPAAVEISRGGTTTAIRTPGEGHFDWLYVTPRAVFFGGANGSVNGNMYVYDVTTRTVYRTFDSPSFYDTFIVNRGLIAWLQNDPKGPDPEYLYKSYVAKLRD